MICSCGREWSDDSMEKGYVGVFFYGSGKFHVFCCECATEQERCFLKFRKYKSEKEVLF